LISRLGKLDTLSGNLCRDSVPIARVKGVGWAEELVVRKKESHCHGRVAGERRYIHRGLLVVLVAWLFPLYPPRLAAEISAMSIAEELVAVGPRSTGSAAHAQALQRVREALAPLTLAEVRVVGGASEEPLATFEAVLPGRGGGEILLTAHLDTVAHSPGALDDASGCAVAIAALHDLARTPLSHSVRLLLFDGEELGLQGSRSWLNELDAERRADILAVINLEMVGARGARGRRPVVVPLPAQGPRGGQRRPPGWLVHAVLRGLDTVGWPAAVADRRHSIASQLLLRVGYPARGADSQPFVRVRIPAIVLTDLSLWEDKGAGHSAADGVERLDPARLERWTTATAAIVRRLDALAGRPRGEEEYLVLAGRVWLRRDIYWVGFALWVLLLLVERRRWQGSVAGARRRVSLFRFSFLAAALVAPSLAMVLLYPMGALTLLPRGGLRWQRGKLAVGLLPIAGLLLVCLLALLRGTLAWWSPPVVSLTLIGVALATGGALLLRAGPAAE